MKSDNPACESGFTLIEVIVTIVALAFVVTMMAGYFGTAMMQSSAPLTRLNAVSGLNLIMEKITAQYNQLPHWHPATAYAANTIVIPTAPKGNGLQYRTASGGTSSATNEPSWPIMTGQSVTDGTVTWQQNGNAPTLTALHTQIGVTEGQDYNQTFGSDTTPVGYRVIENRFIKFDPATNQEVSPLDSTDPLYGRFLKVTIALPLTAPNRTAQTRTALFVMR